jgi:16S rRNA (cytosine967-C5)-methyltransferase
MKISPARIVAYEILTKIETEKSYSSVLLPLGEEKLEPKDRGLCHEITLGTLRKQIYLDAIIEKLTKDKKVDTAIRIILRSALYQLMFLDKIPAHAAINDAVNLTQKVKKTSAKGFVNVILRRFTREIIELDFADKIERISVETSHPRWLIERWIRQFGIVETERLANTNNETPKLDFRFTAKTSDATKKMLRDENTEKSFLRELAENGEIYFQDEASQLVANAVNLQSNESYLDVCCAPASKFSLINYLAGEKNKLFVGGDLHEQRLKTVQRICERTGVKSYSILAYDAEKNLPFADEYFDVVLLDAPCSGTGTIRHNPEIRYFLDEKDFAELSAKQLTILKNASKLLKRGGRLIYSTCSLETEENEAVCEAFLAENSEFKLVQPNLPEQFITEKGFARTFPQRDKMDGFFIAAFSKM